LDEGYYAIRSKLKEKGLEKHIETVCEGLSRIEAKKKDSKNLEAYVAECGKIEVVLLIFNDKAFSHLLTCYMQ